ncbi:MAG: hypothetical protein D6767_09045 [Candidatus Hydrogenedentota bacterium]|nr:MAG: hypothetical protein D6767_09045 [Candidatus Hydrogenedentota bacterium]
MEWIIILILLVIVSIIYLKPLYESQTLPSEESEYEEESESAKRSLQDLELELAIGRLTREEYEKIKEAILIEYKQHSKK